MAENATPKILLGWQEFEVAVAAFDVWLATQHEEVQEMDLLDQIDIYGRLVT